MPKRKATQLETGADVSSTLRRSTRRKSSAPDTAANDNAGSSATPPPSKEATNSRSKSKAKTLKSDKAQATQKAQPRSTATKPVKAAEKSNNDTSNTSDRWYWLLKAEPESRFENGTDVKFSIDDLAARKDPEPWDGIRAYAARNNLRSMKKGELAFFYHSNSHDSKAPYYDPSSKPEDPKWSVVHVKFRSKFAQPIGLKELREMGKPGNPLENMQMLKQTRLSVSRVSPSEWEYLMGVVQKQGGEVPNLT
ncbi:hypothetical protein ONZ43_g4402 [Nemania bipapillata]|uniref:Uncharacterized protein n=1 Tax=Nemania bipapillata TaxID=110536 RepID=A0ACC2IN76_9PEZI|nr:hypothetical protein ONZ43_g4402 [Nemania bipapillata]